MYVLSTALTFTILPTEATFTVTCTSTWVQCPTIVTYPITVWRLSRRNTGISQTNSLMLQSQTLIIASMRLPGITSKAEKKATSPGRNTGISQTNSLMLHHRTLIIASWGGSLEFKAKIAEHRQLDGQGSPPRQWKKWHPLNNNTAWLMTNWCVCVCVRVH